MSRFKLQPRWALASIPVILAMALLYYFPTVVAVLAILAVVGVILTVSCCVVIYITEGIRKNTFTPWED